MSERIKYLYTPSLVRMVAENAFYAGFNASNALFNAETAVDFKDYPAYKEACEKYVKSVLVSYSKYLSDLNLAH
jgi:hypothetical protein